MRPRRRPHRHPATRTAHPAPATSDTPTSRERAREVFLDARDALRAVLEDDIEAGTRATCPAATHLDVETYHDELDEPRGRLLRVHMDTGPADDHLGTLGEALADLLDEWATVANADSEIVFRPLDGPRPPSS
ncbi:hypothetical protein [Frankia sp. R43]|uniref:hypothetical protein n=1 Tax=Frankia sp. R43 TaxID=269536 RepID=UPI0019110235|nr:hypothetical protein [Frankia sp. R43]